MTPEIMNTQPTPLTTSCGHICPTSVSQHSMFTVYNVFSAYLFIVIYYISLYSSVQ